MDIKNLIVAFFIIVIVLAIIFIFPLETQTGRFITPSIVSLQVALILIIFSIFVIAAVVLSRNKSYYPY